MTTTDVRHPPGYVRVWDHRGQEDCREAEVRVYVIPNPLGPVSTAACLQLDACIPNFEVQEYPWPTASAAWTRR